MHDFTIPNPHSDITLVSSEGTAFYYSKYIISISKCKYLQHLIIGPYSAGGTIIKIDVSNALMTLILNTMCGNDENMGDSEVEIYEEILEFSRMSCWHRMLTNLMDDTTAEKLKIYTYEIIDIYPKILCMGYLDLSKVVRRELLNISLQGLNPKVIKFCPVTIKVGELMSEYIGVNSPESIASALRYYIADNKMTGTNDEELCIIMRSLLCMRGIDTNEFITQLRDKFA